MSTTDLDINDSLDLEEPPPTDPSPGTERGAERAVLPRINNPEDDLETRLAWLAAEVRSTSAESAKERRKKSILAAREYKTAFVPAPTRIPTDLSLPKVSLALGVNPQIEPTLNHRRAAENEWEFDISDPEELSRTLPLDPNAAVPDPLPFHSESNTQRSRRHSKFVVALAILGGILIGSLLPRSLTNSINESRYASIPKAKSSATIIAQMTEHYYRAWLANLVKQTQEADGPSEIPEPRIVRPTPPPGVSASPFKKYTPFTFVKPDGSAPAALPESTIRKSNSHKELGF